MGFIPCTVFRESNPEACQRAATGLVRVGVTSAQRRAGAPFLWAYVPLCPHHVECLPASYVIIPIDSRPVPTKEDPDNG